MRRARHLHTRWSELPGRDSHRHLRQAGVRYESRCASYDHGHRATAAVPAAAALVGPFLVMVLVLVGRGRLLAADIPPNEQARSAEFRQSMIVALPDEAAVRTLGENLEQASESDAARLLMELGLSGRSSARPLILAQLQRKNPVIVERALRALALLGVRGVEQRDQVIALLGHRAAAVRIQAIACLETIDDLRVCPLIIERLQDPDPAVARFASVALQNISGREDLGANHASWVGWHRVNQDLSDKRFFKVGERLRSPDGEEVSGAIQALTLITGESARAVEVIEPLLADGDPKVVYAARQALAQLAPDIYSQPTMRERVAALAHASPSDQAGSSAPPRRNPEGGILDTWLVLIAVVAGASGLLWLSIRLLRTAPGRRVKSRLSGGMVNGTNRVIRSGRHAAQKAARRRKRAGPTARSTERPRRLWVPNSAVLKQPWLAALNHRTGLESAVVGTKSQSAVASVSGEGVPNSAEEAPFYSFDRFSPVAEPIDQQTPSSIFTKTERTTRILKNLRGARPNPTGGGGGGQAPAVVAGAVPAPAAPTDSPESAQGAQAVAGSNAPKTDEDPFILFDRFNPTPEPLSEARPTTSIFTNTERTARRLKELRASRAKQTGSGRHHRGATDGALAPRALTDTSLLNTASGESLAAGLGTVEADTATSAADPFSTFDGFNATVTVPEQPPSTIFTKTGCTVRVLKGLRASRLNLAGQGVQQESGAPDQNGVPDDMDSMPRPMLALPIGTAEASADITDEA